MQIDNQKQSKTTIGKHIFANNLFMFDLKTFRKSVAKLSQQEFANKIGFAKGTIGKIEAGSAKITDNILDKIEAVFSVDLKKEKSYYSTEENTIISEPVAAYNDYKTKYLEILEDYKRLADRLADCLESKIEKPTKK